ncbi:MAG TPA: hypothetical protein EYP56_03635 [Planctomycetaceae bacterium]|nr:hypothetical protein [Planctomycetaceae bacterium]
MRLIVATSLGLLGFLAPLAWGGNWAHNQNFIVLAEERSLAESVLAQADRYRRQLAQEWLGEELPPSVGRTIITVTLSESVDRGFTWPIDGPERRYHKMWLTGSRMQLLGSTLEHEMTHVVLATRFPGMLPAWADEGAASLKDDAARREACRRLIAWYARTGNWPDLRSLFQQEAIVAEDRAAYSVAGSVTSYLLSRGDKATFLAFALAGPREGWDAALRSCYGLESVEQLQGAWQAWVERSGAGADRSGPRALSSGGPAPKRAGFVAAGKRPTWSSLPANRAPKGRLVASPEQHLGMEVGPWRPAEPRPDPRASSR